VRLVVEKELPADAEAALRASVASWSEEYAVGVRSINFGSRTLEDVFLDLTGRDIEHD
jgi:ABC-2 type transport system ATP-binding protein